MEVSCMLRKHVILLGLAALFGLVLVVTGILVDIADKSTVYSIVLTTLGTTILFPILVSFAYDQMRERWFGNEVWRIFSELADAGIIRIYKDREWSPNPENADTQLKNEFRNCDAGEILMIGVTLRVFFNEVSPYHGEIAAMLRRGQGRITVRALICDTENPEIENRRQVEDKKLEEVRLEHDATVMTVRRLNVEIERLNAGDGTVINLHTFYQAPYCTMIIFPDKCYFSPNILSPAVPVRLPMIVFRSDSHGFDRLMQYFNYVWEHSKALANSAE
jgi:hypothetical protein